jgi:hypothetical protein
MNTRNLSLLLAVLFAAGIWGCGSNLDSGGDQTAPDTTIANAASVGSDSCKVCHTLAHSAEASWLVGQVSPNSLEITHECESCHGGGQFHYGTGPIPYPTPDITRCAECHASPVENFPSGRHANQSARSGFCSACHSNEGAQVLLAEDRMISRADLAAFYTSDLAVYQLPVGSETIDGVMKKSCATCHEPLKAKLRGDGDVVVTGLLPANGSTLAVDTTRTVYSAEFNLCTGCHMVDLTATFEPTAGYGQRGMYLYELSDKYTSANLVDVVSGTFDLTKAVFYHDGASGNGRTLVDTHFGGTIMQQLVAFDGSADDIPIKGYNINPGNEDACTICHDPHTAGKLLSIEASSTTVEYSDIIDNKAISYAEGLGDFHTNYLDDPFSRVSTSSSCMPCHSGNAYLQKVLGDDISDNNWKVVGCRTCHNLDQPNSTPASNDSAAFAQVRAFPAGYEFAFNSGEVVDVAALGNNQICFDCHKGRTPGVDVTALTEADAGTMNYTISYLHYAPSMAILYGDDSKMVATYPGKTYSGRFEHPVAIDGVTQFGCVDCHDVHNTNANHVVDNKMQNPAYSCNTCHGVGASYDAAVLQTRTEAFSVRLLEAIYDDMADAYALKVFDNARYLLFNSGLVTQLEGMFETLAGDRIAQDDSLMAYIQERQKYFPNIAVAHAATSWKVFTYEDGAPQGQAHGHGGSWAHNSAFARQVMYDAIESLGGDLTSLTRP